MIIDLNCFGYGFLTCDCGGDGICLCGLDGIDCPGCSECEEVFEEVPCETENH